MPGCARQIQRGGLQRLGTPPLVRPRVTPRQRPLTLLGRVPPLTDCARATLADIEPPRDIDCPEVELEERVIRDGLDHAANAASRHHAANQSPNGRVVRHLGRDRADAELIIVRAWERVDHAARVLAQVQSFRRRAWNRDEEAAAREDRADRMQTRASVAPDGRKVADGKPRNIHRLGGAAMQGDHSRPKPRRDRGQLRRLSLELRPAGHSAILRQRPGPDRLRPRSPNAREAPRAFRPSASRPVSLTAQWLACDRCQVAPYPGPKSPQRRTVSTRRTSAGSPSPCPKRSKARSCERSASASGLWRSVKLISVEVARVVAPVPPRKIWHTARWPIGTQP